MGSSGVCCNGEIAEPGTRAVAVSTLIGFTRILSGLPRHGCRQAARTIVTAPGPAVQLLQRVYLMPPDLTLPLGPAPA